MTIQEIVTNLMKSSISKARIVYDDAGTRVFCTGCGMSGKQALKLRHKKGCINMTYYNTIYELEKAANKATNKIIVKEASNEK
jgi:hypothetical protein